MSASPGGLAEFYVPTTTSTMDEARRLSGTAPTGFVRAGEQLAGRGRLPGRSWVGEAGASLLVTFWFPAGAFGEAPLPMIAGLALVRACASWAAGSGVRFREPPLLKWPNDALCGGRKLAGILCEAAAGTIYAGIGVNCSQGAFPPGLRTEPTSILLETGSAPRPPELLRGLAAAFDDLRASPGRWKDEYESVLAWRGRPVRFRPGVGEASIDGVLSGVDASGALLIASGDRPDAPATAYHSGELSVRY